MSPTSPPAPVCCAGCYARKMHKSVYERRCVSSHVKCRFYAVICTQPVERDPNGPPRPEGRDVCGTLIITKGSRPKVFKQWSEYLRNNEPYHAVAAAPAPPTTRF